MADHATGDFETRSACNILKYGAWIYSKHPTTEVMCLQHRLPDYLPGRTSLWHMAHPQHLIGESEPPADLFRAIDDGVLFEAHNSFFEWCIWNNIMVPRYGWPTIPHDQWRCSAAKASAAALPRKLATACEVLQLPVQKSKDGHRLMLKMSKPRKPRKAEKALWQEEHGDEPMPLLWHEEEEDLYRLWNYCGQDVLAEEGLSDFVRDLSDHELRVWQVDQRINQRGVRVDVDLCRAALKMAETWKARLNEELFQMTGVERGSMRQRIKDWLGRQEELVLPDTTGDTLERYITNEDISGRARRVCEIVLDVNRTSTRKYQTMLNMADPEDWRVRDIIRYCGAERTGRWAGSGIQVHNFPARDLIVEDMDEAARDIKSGDVDWCEVMYGDVMKLLSHALRGAIVPTPGRKFAIADYAAIEARVILWLAGAEDALQVFYRGEDIYCDMAAGIYGREIVKGRDIPERQFGKQSILGLGFGMGYITFLLTCRKYDIKFTREQVLSILGQEGLIKYERWVRSKLLIGSSGGEDANTRREAGRNLHRLADAHEEPRRIVHELALMKYTVDVYRARYPEVKELWSALEDAAIRAVRTGEPQECGKVTWFTEGRFLYCRLPSGRLMSYLDPRVKSKMTPWGETRPHLSYTGPHPTTKRPTRIGTYGGKLAENVTQATARDAMADATVNAEDDDTYDPVMSVHDELISEVDEGLEDRKVYERLMSDVRPWAKGCPITAEAGFSYRYKK